MIQGIILTIIGALPFGLVNMSVIKITLQEDLRKAMHLALGASIIEVMFASVALVLSADLSQRISDSLIFQMIITGIIFAIGIFFLRKREKEKTNKNPRYNPFVQGIFLNMISIQVLLYWILALLIVSGLNISFVHFELDSLFLIGVFIGKMGVLYLFGIITQKYLLSSKYLFNNINKVIGMIMIAIGLFQTVKLMLV